MFKIKNKYKMPKPTYARGNIKKATTRYSSKNQRHVGCQVGKGKFAKRFKDEDKAEKYAAKLMKMGKGLEKDNKYGRVCVTRPLYLGTRASLLKSVKRR